MGLLYFQGGLMGYTATKKEPRLVDWAENLDDISYDGQQDGSHTVVGLGQLADGIITDNRTSSNGTFFGQSFLDDLFSKNNNKRFV